MGFCKFNEIAAGTSGHRPLRGAAVIRGRRDAVPYNGSSHPSAGGDAHTSPRRTNAHFAAGHMGPALQGTPVMQDGTSRTPSPTTAHRTHPQGGDAHTSPRRTNAHLAAGHMGPALQGTPVMQDGTSGRRPLQRLTVPVRRGTIPTHRPAGSTKRQAQAPASLLKKSGWTFSTSWQAKSQNKNYILFCDFGRCGGCLDVKGNPDGSLSHYPSLRYL